MIILWQTLFASYLDLDRATMCSELWSCSYYCGRFTWHNYCVGSIVRAMLPGLSATLLQRNCYFSPTPSVALHTFSTQQCQLQFFTHAEIGIPILNLQIPVLQYQNGIVSLTKEYCAVYLSLSSSPLKLVAFIRDSKCFSFSSYWAFATAS